jgi:translation initiation factor 2B subunit (eIF-2B alpha/beta/delta family)
MVAGESNREQAAAHVRAELTPVLQEAFDLLWSKKALGSSIRLSATAAFLTQFAGQTHAASGRALLNRVCQVQQILTGDWFYQAALLNGTAWLLAIPVQDESEVVQIRMELEERSSRLLEMSQQAKQRIATFLANVLGEVKVVLVHDYSSTVMDALRRCAASGRSLCVYATACHTARADENRVLQEAASVGHVARSVDALALGTLLASGVVDALLVGADAVLASGELINTAGTLPLAVLAHHFRVPVYCPTELMKLLIPSLSGRTLTGQPRENIAGDYAPLFDVTPGEFLHAYITEFGLIPPAAYLVVAREHTLISELL